MLHLKEIVNNKTNTFAEWAAQQEKEKRAGVGNFITLVNCGTTDVEEKVTSEVEKIEVLDASGKKLDFLKKFNAEKAVPAQEEITYKITLKNDDPEVLKKDVKAIKYCFWLEDPKGNKVSIDSASKTILCNNKGNEASTDTPQDLFEVKETETLTKNLEKAFYYAKRTQTDTESILKIKFSKWLDGYKLRVEFYFCTIKADGGDTTISRFIASQPEIVDGYWLNAEGKKILQTGYKQDIYLYLKTLGLKDQELMVNVYDKDYYPTPNQPTIYYGRAAKDDLIEWKNNTVKIEGRDTIKQFKVGNKIRYENATADEDQEYKTWYDNAISQDHFFAIIDPTQKNSEDLELYIHFPDWKTIKLPADNEYAKLGLTTKERIADAFFAKIEKEEVLADAPNKPIYYKDKKTGKQKKSSKTKPAKAEVPYYKKIDNGVLGQKVQLVAACANLEGKKVIFKIYEKEPLLVEKDTVMTVLDIDGKEVKEIKAKVKDGYAVAKIELKHKKKQEDNKDWLDKLKNGFYDKKGKTANLFITVTCTGEVEHKETFLKDSSFNMIGNNWHEPVDDPQIAMYTQGGHNNPQNNTYGTARGYTHAGLDLFALEGSNVYACLDGEVLKVQEWTRKSGKSGYGHNIILKVDNAQEVRNRRREYTLPYSTDKKQANSFNPDSDIYLLRYAHLEDVLVKVGDKVSAGKIIGKTGISGVIAGTSDPHLHFNIYSDKRNDAYLVNPAYYVYWKEINDLTDEDKKIQEKRKKKYPTEALRKKNANPAPKISLKDPKRT